MKEEKIIVYTNDKQVYWLTNFAITDTHIVGTIIKHFPPDDDQLIGSIKIIKLEDIKLIQVERTKRSDINATGVLFGCLAGIGLIGLIIIIACAASD